MSKNHRDALGVYSVVFDHGCHDQWIKIGSAIRHPDGKGFDVELRALPLTAKLVLREPEEEPGASDWVPLARQVEAFERATIERCLLEAGGNIGAALERLKIPRRTLNEKMARLGIDRRELKSRLQGSVDELEGVSQAGDRASAAHDQRADHNDDAKAEPRT